MEIKDEIMDIFGMRMPLGQRDKYLDLSSLPRQEKKEMFAFLMKKI